MENRNNAEFNPPHKTHESYIIRYFEHLMQLTYDHPVLMRNIIYVVGASSLALTVSPWLLPKLGLETPINTATAAVAGSLGTVISAVSGFAQHKIFGFPVAADYQGYQSAKFEYHSASGELQVNKDSLPILRIKASNHYDAGFVEGYMLAVALKDILAHMSFLFPIMTAVFGAPIDKNKLSKSLDEVVKHIPNEYMQEIKGKVSGYNVWLSDHYPAEEQLLLEHYLLLQLLPDLRNYNPFPRNKMIEKAAADLMNLVPAMSCTSIILQMKNHTFFTRVLDWPSHNVAGKYILQVDRSIGDTKRTSDICIPAVSGALTVLNENGLLVQINVAHGPEVLEAQGMPSIFFNRYCAEHASTVAEIDDVLKVKQPLGAYHMTASDGLDTKSFHFYQSKETLGAHVVESFSGNGDAPQLLVVANHGVQFKGAIPQIINHRDSVQRLDNVHQFFHHESVMPKLQNHLQQLKDGDLLTTEDTKTILNVCLQAAKLPLVNTNESILCAQYHFEGNKLQSAFAATDNLFAQSRHPEEFKQVNIPRI